MTRVVVTARAKADLQRIWSFIALDSEPAATRLLQRIDQRLRQLETFPESGSPQDDIRPGVRLLVVAGYRILYGFDAELDTVRIVTLVEPYRDYDE